MMKELSPASAGVKSFRSRLTEVSIALVSWTFPRLGFFKFSEAFAMLAVPGLLVPSGVLRTLARCYLPFTIATIFSLCVAIPMVGHGSQVLTSSKGLYSNPEFVPFVTLAHILVYLVTVAVMTQYFSLTDSARASKSLRWAYYMTIAPGLLQIFRIYSGIHFSIPYFERPDVGPFSGVFNSGYLRAMGFEFEPLAYASSLVTVCCLSMHNGRRIPWLGLFVLWHTYGAGAIAGALLALCVSLSRKMTQLVVPLYAAGFVAVSWFIVAHIRALVSIFILSGSITERLGAFYGCIAMWLDHPMGVGLGLYGYFFNHYDVTGLFPAASLDYYPNNDPAMFLVYGGPLYLAAYFYTYYFVLRRARSYWVCVAAMALLFQSVSSYLFFNPAIILVFALLLSDAEPLPREQPHPAALALPATQ